MKFGAHAFIWEADWNEEAGKRVIKEVSRIGLDYVEIPLLEPDTVDGKALKELLDESGIKATYSLALPTDKSLPMNPAGAEAFLKRAIDVVALAGGDVLTGVTYASLGDLPNRPPCEADYETIAGTMKKVAAYGADKGVRIGIEPVNRYETFLVNTSQQAMDLLDRIDSDNVFIHLDTYHLNIEEESYSSAIKLAGKRMGYIHLSESNRGTPGKGTVDWDDVFTGLRDIDFTGILVMESFVNLNPSLIRATCMWRKIVTDSEALVRDGMTFLSGKAKQYGLS